MTQDNDQEAHNWSMLCHLGSIVWIPLTLFLLILVIFVAIKAEKGEFYQYPFTIWFLR